VTRAINAFLLSLALLCNCFGVHPLQVSENGRFLQTADGKPFFWLGDTAWLLFHRLNREQTLRYLDDRQTKGFNVIQVMLLRSTTDTSAAGDAALIDEDPPRPNPGGYWDHVDWVLDRAAERGIYVALVCSWGSLVSSGKLHEGNVEPYTRFVVNRYKAKPNLVWVVGGDVHGDRKTEVWQTMGRVIKELDSSHLVTYHPFGRTQSSTWFHNAPWLDFNMFQSGHRRYDQDETPNAKGEDNWKYVLEDYARVPAKPTLDGEPSYENLPQGLHDPKEPYWGSNEVRRYAWWSVLAGACGHTYGENAVMQMFQPGKGSGAYGVKSYWDEALDAPGAGQMQYVKQLMLSRPYFERVPDAGMVVDNGDRYDYVAASRGKTYAVFYTWTGRRFRVRLGVIAGAKVKAAWFDPRTGAYQQIGTFTNEGIQEFDPPGKPKHGNDWVLVLDEAKAEDDAGI
jgi:hypothetical protein